MTKDELIKTYSNASNETLVDIYKNQHDYSDAAKEALTVVLDKRGGIEQMLVIDDKKNAEIAETKKIAAEAMRLLKSGGTQGFLNTMITSDILSHEQVQLIITDTVAEYQKDLEDQQVKPGTIFGGMIASIIAGIICGIIWAIQLIWTGRIFYILAISVVVISYYLIKAFTKQSYKNTAVFIFTIVAIFIAFILGQVLFEIVGRKYAN